MTIKKIANNVYATSVLNPNMRTFDVIMRTENGTSYNSYIVEGTEKTALIETAHIDYFNNFIENINEITSLEKVEYLIMNHNEPDHSGSIAKLLKLVPNLKIITTKAGSIFLKNIVNEEMPNIIVAKDGDEIDLGSKTLKFITAPFLHWSDSMFTYLKEEKLLFSCDFLGTHYCEPQIFDTKISHIDDYTKSVKNYFDAIFSPFKPYVRNGLEKIKDLQIDIIAPSHGPILTKNCQLENLINCYKEWSEEKPKEKISIPIFYCSAYKNTEKIANSIADGIRIILPNSDVKTYDIIKHDMKKLSQELNESDAFLIGTPTINRDAVPPVMNLLNEIDAINISKRQCAVFGSFGWSGEGIPNVKVRLQSLKVNLFDEDFKVNFVPTNKDLENAVDFGERFAQGLKL